MNDCGVCLTMDCDEIAFDIDQELVVSDGSIKCCECNKKIPKDVKYEVATLYFGDQDAEEEEGADETSERWSDTYKTCVICAEIAEAFYCGGRVYGGCLWDSMDYVWEELTTSCFDKLQTPEAKAELRRRWIVWKGLA